MIRRNVLCLFWHSCSDNSLIIVAVNLAKLINFFRLLLCICLLVSFNDKSFRTPFRQTGLHCSKTCASIFFQKYSLPNCKPSCLPYQLMTQCFQTEMKMLRFSIWRPSGSKCELRLATTEIFIDMSLSNQNASKN